MTFLLLLTNLIIALPAPSTSPADSVRRPLGDATPYTDAAAAARPLPEHGASQMPGWDPWVVSPEAPMAGEASAPDAVHQRRNRFIELVKFGLFERFDDLKQEATFKRTDPSSRAVHEPGPLEDEAIAAAAREALAALYSKLNLKPHLGCHSGKLSIGTLPDDPSQAASVIDTMLVLDGVEIVTATLPPSLRLP